MDDKRAPASHNFAHEGCIATPAHRPLLYLIITAERIMRGMRDEAFKPYGITAADYGVLARFRDFGSHSSADLSRELFLTPQAIGQAVARLEERELISRESDPHDGRRMQISLSQIGRELMLECTEVLQPIEALMTEGLSPREIQFMTSLFDAALTNLEKAHRSSAARPA